jgi:acyl-CoA synthetase (AMP-forming)/AMP-acid ligase II
MKDEDRKPFPTWIDERAAETPERVFALIPRTNVVKDGYQEFTYRQLARAVDKLSWFLDQELGSPPVDFETIAYMGVSDLRYTILYIAVQKTRRQVCFSHLDAKYGNLNQDVQVLFPSDQSSRPAHLSLLSATNCKVLIASKEMVGLWENLRPEIDGFKTLTMPNLETFLVDEKVEKYPYTLTWEESKHDPVFIVHTSGSTGRPANIDQTFTLTLHRPSKTNPLYCTHDVHLQPWGLLAEVAKLESSGCFSAILVFRNKFPHTNAP